MCIKQLSDNITANEVGHGIFIYTYSVVVYGHILEDITQSPSKGTVVKSHHPGDCISARQSKFPTTTFQKQQRIL